MGEPALQLVETEEVETKALTIVDQAKAVTVIDSGTYISAGVFWKSIGDMIKEVKATFDPICEAANKAHKTATAKRAQYLDPLETAYKSVKRLMSDYDTEQERIRKVEEARLQEIARKQEEERRLQEAILAEQSGNKEEAEAIIEAPIQSPPVVLQKTVPKMQGGPVYREIWKVRIVNEKLLPRDMMTPDLVKLASLARALKNQFNVSGAEAYSERV